MSVHTRSGQFIQDHSAEVRTYGSLPSHFSVFGLWLYIID